MFVLLKINLISKKLKVTICINSKFNVKEKDGACLDWSKAGELGDAGAFDLIKKYCN